MANGNKSELILDIQRDIIEDSTGISTILRQARLAAKKLELTEFTNWLDLETEGYAGDENHTSMPKYRYLAATPKFFNPFHGWLPILTNDSDLHEALHRVFCPNPIEEVEALSKADSSGTIHVHYNLAIENFLRKSSDLNGRYEIRAFISPKSLANPVNSVKKIILDWAIDLEAAGVTGAGLGFTRHERKEAQTVTQNIYAQNIGNLGNVEGISKVTNNVKDSSYTVSITQDQITQIRDAVPALPAEKRAIVLDHLSNLEQNPSKSKSILTSLREVCEGMAGNLSAQDILSLLNSIK